MPPGPNLDGGFGEVGGRIGGQFHVGIEAVEIENAIGWLRVAS